MTKNNQTSSKVKEGSTSDRFWNYHPEVPLKFAPYFDSPKDIKAILVHWLRTWKPQGTQFIFLVLATLIWFFATPSLERTGTFQFDWIFEIWLRDMILMLTITGGLHLYLHTFKKQGSLYKYDKRELSKNARRFHFNNQNLDNMFWTLTTGVLCWTFWESLLLWGYANGYATLISPESNPIWFFVLLALIPLWTLVYFDLQHRLLHKEAIYKYIHSWHHKNGNTGPWSGLAMHPVEQFILMSDNILFFIIPSHPIHVIYDLIFHGLGAPTSHAGFERLKITKNWHIHLGDFYHQLHHRFFDSNYGSLETPWDKWADCYHDGSMEGHKKFMQQRKKKTTPAA